MLESHRAEEISKRSFVHKDVTDIQFCIILTSNMLPLFVACSKEYSRNCALG